jgi:hypothetical protein
MMVITQACDIIKPPTALPQVEIALVRPTTNAKMIAQAQSFGSARYFRVNSPDQGEALVLDYGQRALIDKGLLSTVSPDNTLVNGWTREQQQRLARWLGRRYDRPAIPDEDYEQITRPIRLAWSELLNDEPETAASYNRVYCEWRYRRETDGSLTVFVLSPDARPDETIALEIASFIVEAIQPCFSGRIDVATDSRSYHTFSKADELTTEQIDMEWASYDEESGQASFPA